MRPRGIVLYGPPASGKSAVTLALTSLDPRFMLLRKLKAGDQRGTEYEFVSAEQLAELRAAGRLLVETHRYGNAYAIDRHQLSRMVEGGQVPVVHMGNIPDLRRLVEGGPWLSVLLWVSREVCERRSLGRGDLDTTTRLQAWDETLADLAVHGEEQFSLRLDTHQARPDELARAIAGPFTTPPVETTSHRA